MDAILDQIEDHLGWVPPWAVGLVMILFAVLFAHMFTASAGF